MGQYVEVSIDKEQGITGLTESEPAVAHNVSCQNGGKTTFGALVGHHLAALPLLVRVGTLRCHWPTRASTYEFGYNSQRLATEFAGTTILPATAVGCGIMARWLASGTVGLHFFRPS